MYPCLNNWLISELVSSVDQQGCLNSSPVIKLGLRINQDKSALTPMQSVEFIGAFLVLVHQDISSSREIYMINCFICHLQSYPKSTVRDRFSLLGHIVACIYMNLYVWLYLQTCYGWLRTVYRLTKHSMDIPMEVPQRHFCISFCEQSP